MHFERFLGFFELRGFARVLRGMLSLLMLSLGPGPVSPIVVALLLFFAGLGLLKAFEIAMVAVQVLVHQVDFENQLIQRNPAHFRFDEASKSAKELLVHHEKAIAVVDSARPALSLQTGGLRGPDQFQLAHSFFHDLLLDQTEVDDVSDEGNGDAGLCDVGGQDEVSHVLAQVVDVVFGNNARVQRDYLKLLYLVLD